MVSRAFGGWLILNGILDFVPLGALPIFGIDSPLPGPKITDFFEGPLGLHHRMCAWFFISAGSARFAAGYGRSNTAKQLAAISYILEAVMFAIEVIYGTITFKKAAPGIVFTICCAAILMFGYPEESPEIKFE